jgi:hypothetical protein
VTSSTTGDGDREADEAATGARRPRRPATFQPARAAADHRDDRQCGIASNHHCRQPPLHRASRRDIRTARRLEPRRVTGTSGEGERRAGISGERALGVADDASLQHRTCTLKPKIRRG